MRTHPLVPTLLATAVLAFGHAAQAQSQKVSPPEAQLWIDLATISGIGMPGIGGPGAVNPMAMIGSLLGARGGAGANRFGNTQSGAGGRWMDVTVSSRRQPLAEATMNVPPGSGLAPAVQLVSPREAPAAPPSDDDTTPPREPERPRGKVSLYWGCGETVRPGQPRTLDFSSALPADLAQIFSGRRATQRGAHSAAGRPQWPNETDSRLLPAAASVAGEMSLAGAGLPEGWRFTLPAAQDLMPAVALRQAEAGGATKLAWSALPTARGYFIAAMGGQGGPGGPGGAGAQEVNLVLWTSSELPDSGFGLMDYQTNAAVDRWLRDKVLLPPAATECTVPRGVFTGPGAMLRFIAYGSELNLAHPPRPTDPRQPWEPKWAVKVRIKSTATAMLGMEMPVMPGAAGEAGAADGAASAPEGRKPSALDRLRDLLGR